MLKNYEMEFNLNKVKEASSILRNVVSKTPLLLNINKSAHFKANIYFKREDLQQIRSYKVRGAYRN